MLRKGKNRNIYKTATNVNNYNNFLIALDKNVADETNNNETNNNETNNDETKLLNDLKNKDSIFYFNKEIKEEYKKTKCDSSFVSGIRPNEDVKNDEFDPNEYVEYKEKRYKKHNLTLKIP